MQAQYANWPLFFERKASLNSLLYQRFFISLLLQELSFKLEFPHNLKDPKY